MFIQEPPKYLVPTRETTLCSDGASCCVADWEAQPYWFKQLNSSMLTMDGQVYTTFYMMLNSNSAGCTGACCNFDISKIWVDVDPKLKVEYASFDGAVNTFEAQQDMYGYHITPNAGNQLTIPTEGLLMTITVQGTIPRDQLCPTPDFTLGVHMEGVCQVIVYGTSPSNSAVSCCPNFISEPIVPGDVFVPSAPVCQAELDQSPHRLSLYSVSTPYSQGTSKYANYTFVLTSNAACDSTVINSCCQMGVDVIDLDIVSGIKVSKTLVGGVPVQDVTFSPHPDNVAMQVMSIRSIGLASGEIPPQGVAIVLTVQVPQTATTARDLCRVKPSADGTVGDCAFALYPSTANSLCCPAGDTNAVMPGETPVNPPGTCFPEQPAPISDTTMGFNYYEGPIDDAADVETKFVFLVYNNGTCHQTYCSDVCNWQLNVNPQIMPFLSFLSGDGSNGGPVLDSALGTVTFTQPPAHASTQLYTIIVNKRGATLDMLCRKNSVPGQVKACASIVRSPLVYSTVQFDQNDVVVPGYGPPAPAPYCTDGMPLANSCVRVDTAGYNAAHTSTSSSATSTVMDFKVSNHDGQAGCTPEDSIMTFQLLLQSQIVAELRQSNALVPTSVVFGPYGQSITWTWTPITPGDSMHYQLVVQGNHTPSTICLQGMVDNQPEDACAVAFHGATQCYTGAVDVLHDSNLTPIQTPDQPTKSSSAIIPAVVVPIVVVACLLVAGAWWYRRRKLAAGAGGFEADSLTAPLGGSSVAGSAASGSGVHLRFPGSS